jgi:pimeloyl-ACP methyl ester carboxylesterase
MNALLVHGMGRSSLSWLPTLGRFRANGIHVSTFSYGVSNQDFSAIASRLTQVLLELSSGGDYIVIGHSLGGVLLRAALDQLPAGTLLPKIMFLLGSPVSRSRIAMHLRTNVIFRAITGDCGQLLGSSERMKSIPVPPVTTVAIIGTKGPRGTLTPFGLEVNDGVVAVSEVCADWLTETICLPVIHTVLPSSKCVIELLIAYCGEACPGARSGVIGAVSGKC